MTVPSLTQSELKEILNYDPDTGIFTNIIKRSARAMPGTQAGYVSLKGYRTIKVGDKDYLAHRLAWFYIYGFWPENFIDHINQCKDDNSIINLRDVTKSQNGQNSALSLGNKSGFKGVHWDRFKLTWIAYITLNNQRFHLGRFKDLNEAITVRKRAEEQLHSHRALA